MLKRKPQIVIWLTHVQILCKVHDPWHHIALLCSLFLLLFGILWEIYNVLVRQVWILSWPQLRVLWSHGAIFVWTKIFNGEKPTERKRRHWLYSLQWRDMSTYVVLCFSFYVFKGSHILCNFGLFQTEIYNWKEKTQWLVVLDRRMRQVRNLGQKYHNLLLWLTSINWHRWVLLHLMSHQASIAQLDIVIWHKLRMRFYQSHFTKWDTWWTSKITILKQFNGSIRWKLTLKPHEHKQALATHTC